MRSFIPATSRSCARCPNLPFFFAIVDDALGDAFGDPGNQRQLIQLSDIKVGADLVDAFLHGVAQAATELLGVDLVVVLPDTQHFGVHLDQFAERILQAARQRNRAAHHGVGLGKFAPPVLGSGVNPRSRLVDGGPEHFRRAGLANFAADEFFHLPHARPIADHDGRGVMFGDEFAQADMRNLDAILAALLRGGCRAAQAPGCLGSRLRRRARLAGGLACALDGAVWCGRSRRVGVAIRRSLASTPACRESPVLASCRRRRFAGGSGQLLWSRGSLPAHR